VYMYTGITDESAGIFDATKLHIDKTMTLLDGPKRKPR
jgi:hypothetical protein